MSVFQQHFDRLKERFPTAKYTPRADGSFLVAIPDFALIEGWNKATTTVYFVALPSYPYAKPDCFWTDPDLRLKNGGTPQSATVNNSHGGPESLLWFSYHINAWNSNRDSLLTYLNVIRQRLNELR